MEEMPYGGYGRQPAFVFSQNWKSILLLFFIEKVEINLRMESEKQKLMQRFPISYGFWVWKSETSSVLSLGWMDLFCFNGFFIAVKSMT